MLEIASRDTAQHALMIIAPLFELLPGVCVGFSESILAVRVRLGFGSMHPR